MISSIHRAANGLTAHVHTDGSSMDHFSTVQQQKYMPAHESIGSKIVIYTQTRNENHFFRENFTLLARYAGSFPLPSSSTLIYARKQ